jgi:hypothetical protein
MLRIGDKGTPGTCRRLIRGQRWTAVRGMVVGHPQTLPRTLYACEGVWILLK